MVFWALFGELLRAKSVSTSKEWNEIVDVHVIIVRMQAYTIIIRLELSSVHLTRQFPLCSARPHLELLLEASNALRDLNVARNYNKYYDPKLDLSDHELPYGIILDTPVQRRRPILNY